jgi:hypothetical protein
MALYKKNFLKYLMMKKIFTFLLMLAAMAGHSQSTTIVISQVYGAGGNTGATLNADFVELHNISAVPQSTAGFSIQYASATNTATWTGVSALPTATIPAGGYYLIQMSTTGLTGVALPTPDYVSNPPIAMGGVNGKVALVNNTTPLVSSGAGCPTTASAVIDFVGYGSANCGETAPTPGLTVTDAIFRNNNGCTDTNNNLADFSLAPVAPRNSSSPVSVCGGPSGPAISVSALTAFGNVCINTTVGPNSFVITGSNLTTADIVVGPLAGFTFSTTSGGIFVGTLTIAHAAGALTQPVFVKFTPTAIASYNGNIAVTGGGVITAVNVAVIGAGANIPPSVVTGAASGITGTTATAGGTIGSNGCTAVTGYGIEYSTTNGFTPGTGTVVSSGNLSGGSFTSSLTGLTPGTTYYYVAYATNGGGTGYGMQMSFTTAPPVTPIFSAGALSGFGSVCINSNGGPNSFVLSGTNLTTANVVIGPFAGYTFSTTSGGTYQNTMNITQPGGTYNQPIFVKFTPTAVATYNGNIPVMGGGAPAFSVPVTGSGVNAAPAVTTGSASAITANSATLAGTISSNGCSAVSGYGIEYSLVNGFANGSGTSISGTNLSGSGYSVNLSGLTAATTYYYKAFATNAGGTGYGMQMSFTTAAPPPASFSATALPGFGLVCVNSVSAPISFDLSGVNLNNSNIVVGPFSGYLFSSTATGTFTPSLTITQPGGTFSQTIFVQFAPVAEASYDGNVPVTGAGASLLNVPVLGTGIVSIPFVVTSDSLLVSPNIVVANGILADPGCTAVIAYGIEYSGVNGFADGTGTKVPATNLTGNDFSSRLTGLVQNTAYYYKAYAQNTGGISYGEQKLFFTPAFPSGLVIYSTPAIRGTLLHYSVNGIKPGNYTMRLINYMGQEVARKPMIVQLDFIDARYLLPASLPIGPYILQLVSPDFQVQQSFMVQ